QVAAPADGDVAPAEQQAAWLAPGGRADGRRALARRAQPDLQPDLVALRVAEAQLAQARRLAAQRPRAHHLEGAHVLGVEELVERAADELLGAHAEEQLGLAGDG